MKSDKQDKNNSKNILNEPVSDYEKAELDLLRSALNKSYTERFLTMMRLIKMGIMFRNAKITRPEQY
jgi:hypothetical protein